MSTSRINVILEILKNLGAFPAQGHHKWPRAGNRAFRGSALSRSGPNVWPQAAKRRGCSAPLQSLAQSAPRQAGVSWLPPCSQAWSFTLCANTIGTAAKVDRDVERGDDAGCGGSETASGETQEADTQSGFATVTLPLRRQNHAAHDFVDTLRR
jgi:hypothetical protein